MRNYVKIKGDDRRFEANFNALGKALVLLGMDDLNGLVEISQVRPSTFPVVFSCCLNEGARLDGESWSITPDEAGALSILEMREMLTVYVGQLSPDIVPSGQKKEQPAE